MTDAEAILHSRMKEQPIDPARAEQMRSFAARLLRPMREKARELGYALGLHGSAARDIDLIAAPWTEEAIAPIELAHALRDVAQEILGFEPAVGYCLSQAKKPHGREGFSIHLVKPHDMTVGEDGLTSSPYIDLSILPPVVVAT